MGEKFYKVLCLILAVLLCLMALCWTVLYWTGFIEVYDIVAVEVDTAESDIGGLYIEDSENSGAISLSSTKLTEDEYEDYGISLLSANSVDSAYVVSIDAEYFVPYTYDWTCTNTTEISLSVSETTQYCVITCTGAFDTQAVVTVQSQIFDSVSATVTLDYVCRVESVEFSLSTGNLIFTNNGSTTTTIEATPIWGTGTIIPTLTIDGGTMYDVNATFVKTDAETLSYNGKAYTVYFVSESLDYSFSGSEFSVTTPWAMFAWGLVSQYWYTVATPAIGVLISEIPNFGEYAPSDEVMSALYTEAFVSNLDGVRDINITVNYTVSYTPSDSDVLGSYSSSGSASFYAVCDVSALGY